MRLLRNSGGFASYRFSTNHRTTSLGVSQRRVGGQGEGEDSRCNRLTPLSRKHLQTIGVYLTDFFGSNVRFRILRELGSTKEIACVSEIIFPDRFYGTRVGITRNILMRGEPVAV